MSIRKTFAMSVSLAVRLLLPGAAGVAMALVGTAPRAQDVVSSAPPPSTYSQWGVLAQLAGSHWAASRDGTISHVDSFEWERPGEVLVLRSTDPDSSTIARWTLAPDGMIDVARSYWNGSVGRARYRVEGGAVVNWDEDRSRNWSIGLDKDGLLVEATMTRGSDGKEQSTTQSHSRLSALVAQQWRADVTARLAERQQRFRLMAGGVGEHLSSSLRTLDGKTHFDRAFVREDGRFYWNGWNHTFEGAGAGRYECANRQKPCAGAFKVEKGSIYWMPDDGGPVSTLDCNIPGYCRMMNGRLLLTEAGFREPSVRMLADEQVRTAAQDAQQQVAQQQATARAANEARWAADDARREREEAEERAHQRAMNAAMVQGMATIIAGRPVAPPPAAALGDTRSSGGDGGADGYSWQSGSYAPAAPTRQERRCMAGEIYRWDGNSWVHTFQKCTDGGVAQQAASGAQPPAHGQVAPTEGERRCMAGEISRWERTRWVRTFQKC
ncbi:hypothetical protein [Phenylobacterium sp.]|uniref:hypothetical protein n=1 Tax=Phenylobacterium sp. TaxID=1871053 RepID=UPI00301E197D